MVEHCKTEFLSKNFKIFCNNVKVFTVTFDQFIAE